MVLVQFIDRDGAGVYWWGISSRRRTLESVLTELEQKGFTSPEVQFSGPSCKTIVVHLHAPSNANAVV